MNYSLYAAAFILLAGWVIGVFALSLGGIIHSLLFLSIAALIIRFVKRNKKAY
jgi:hypothetical protein